MPLEPARVNQHLLALAVSLWTLTGSGICIATDQNPSKGPDRVAMNWGIEIPLRDGVRLHATVYSPRDRPLPPPCIVALTPYIADYHHERGVYFASHGFTFAVVDVRGRGNSQGTFRPNIQEAHDGYDVVEWLARQSYCNGKIAMWGGSYLGYAQWATATEFPPHLATIVPTAAPYMGVDFPMRNGIFFPYAVQWLTLTQGNALQLRTFSDRDFWSGVFREWHESGRSFRELDAILGIPLPTFQEWLSHPEPDAYWDAYNPTAEQYARMQIPILTITGTYDDDQSGALEHYSQHMRNASPEARARHYLLIGPWDHSGTGTPRSEFGGLKLGDKSLLNIQQLHLEWYAWTMQGGPKPEFLKAPVTYYIMGAEEWRYADSLEQVTARHETLFLDSVANAKDIFSSGSLGAEQGRGRPDAYTYDPRNTRGPEVDAEARADGSSLVDQSVLIALRGKALVYHSAPLQKDTVISGFFKLSAWISIDRPDTDLYVSVHEIDSAGNSIRLSTDAVRARYREGLRTPKPIRTTAPLRYDFEHFTFISRRVERGHRLRLVIAPMGRLLDTTFAEKNYNGAGIVAEQAAHDARPVTVRLLHDRNHRSALYVPESR
jgi:putative CocE/NonD family hydrolase